MDTVTDHGTIRSAHERLPVVVMRGAEATQRNLEALPAQDGYFSLLIPLSGGNFQIGVLFGSNYRWVQIESTQLIKNQTPSEKINIWPNIVFDQMIHKGGKLFECLSEFSLMVLVLPPKMHDHNHLLQIVFRPVVKKEEKLESK